VEDFDRYLDEIVVPTIQDFAEHPTSVRHAFLACVATCHSVDYLAYPEDPRTLRQKFSHQSPEFAIVDDVAHAFKHVIVGRRDEPRLKAKEVISRPPGILDVSFVLDLSRLDDPVGGVTFDSNREIDLLDAVKGAAEFLRSKIFTRERTGTMGTYKKPSRGEFEIHGDEIVHRPTGATWEAYEGHPEPSHYRASMLGSVLPNGNDYREDEVIEMALRLLADRPKRIAQ
jgi:hypothetical protein